MCFLLLGQPFLLNVMLFYLPAEQLVQCSSNFPFKSAMSSYLARIYNPFPLTCPSLLCHNSKFKLWCTILTSHLYNFPFITYKKPSFTPLATIKLPFVSFHFPPPKWFTKLASSSLLADIRFRHMSRTCLTSSSIIMHPALVVMAMSPIPVILLET